MPHSPPLRYCCISFSSGTFLLLPGDIGCCRISLQILVVLLCLVSAPPSALATQLIYSMGSNYNGQLGTGDKTDRYTPILAPLLSSISPVSAGFGDYSVVIAASNGLVYGIGQNYYGQLGLGDTTDRWTPVLNALISSQSVTKVSAAAETSMLLSSTGLVYSFGINDNGQLGTGDTNSRCTPTLLQISGSSVIAISIAGDFSLTMLYTDVVYTNGNSFYGGYGANGLGITAIDTGYDHSLLLSTNLVHSMGDNSYGQLGLGDLSNRPTPTLITAGGLSTVSVSTIAAGGWHSMLLSRDGFLYVVGFNYRGQLGLGDNADRWTPTLLPFMSSISTMRANLYHSLIIKNPGELYSTGSNDYGQLGTGDNASRNTPTLVVIPSGCSALWVTGGGSNSLCVVSCGCGAGYTGDGSTTCTNINECSTGVHNCNSHANCTDTIGSFSCTCNAGYSGSGTTYCTNVNECTSNTHNCNANSTCTDTTGSFTCACNAGYTGNGTTYCTNVNECTTNTHNCNSNAQCADTWGSFTCACNAGYNGNGTTYCSNIDECTSMATHDCNFDAICTDTTGSFSCACKPGFSGNGITLCSNIDECALSTHNCDAHAMCFNTVGSFFCSCKTGYAGNGVTCGNIDECAHKTHNCNAYATCSDNSGSFTCSCNSGYAGNGTTTCANINECALSIHNCHANANCSDTFGSFTCSCNSGYAGNGTTTCANINECALSMHNCHANANCSDTIGSFTCSCNVGFAGNGIACSSWDLAPKIVIVNNQFKFDIFGSVDCVAMNFSTSTSIVAASMVESRNAIATLTQLGALYTVTAICNGSMAVLSSQVFTSPPSDPISLKMAMNLPTSTEETNRFADMFKSKLQALLSLGSMDQISALVLSSGSMIATFQLAQQNPTSPSPTTLLLSLKTAASNGNLQLVLSSVTDLTVNGASIGLAAATTTTTPPSTAAASSSSSLSSSYTNQIVIGIVIGGVGLFLMIGAASFLLVRKIKHKMYAHVQLQHPKKSSKWRKEWSPALKWQKLLGSNSTLVAHIQKNDPDWTWVEQSFCECFGLNPTIRLVSATAISNQQIQSAFDSTVHLKEKQNGASFLPDGEKEVIFDTRLAPKCIQISELHKTRIFYAWHGCDAALLEGICKHGAHTFGKMEAGHFGGGIYLSLQSEFAAGHSTKTMNMNMEGSVAEVGAGHHRVKDATYAMILSEVCTNSIYPISRTTDYHSKADRCTYCFEVDPESNVTFNKPLKAGFDAHFATVCASEKWEAATDVNTTTEAALYDEIVVADPSQINPILIVYFRPVTPIDQGSNLGVTISALPPIAAAAAANMPT